MSGFGYFARMARDPRLPYGRRYIAFRQAIGAYSWLRRTSFQALYATLAAQGGFYDEADVRTTQPRPTPAQMEAILLQLERDRQAFLERLVVLQRDRRAEKFLGHRRPRPGQMEALFPLRPPRAAVSPPAG
jgi:hypothetical protein